MKISAGAQQLLGLLFRIIPPDQQLLVQAYKTYVRPLLEYAAPVWSPHLAKDILLLESVQRYFTRRVLGYPDLSYTERLIVLGLEFLEMRRLHADLILCYKVLSGLASVKNDNLLVLVSDTNVRSSNRRTNSNKLILPRPNLNTRKFFFSVRLTQIWNSLPDELVFAPNVTIFRSRLHLFDLTQFLTGVCVSD